MTVKISYLKKTINNPTSNLILFTNDKFDSDNIKSWIKRETIIGNNVRIGSNASLLPVKIGKRFPYFYKFDF